MSDEGKLDARYKRLVDLREVERLKDYATTAHAEVARLTAALSEARVELERYAHSMEVATEDVNKAEAEVDVLQKSADDYKALMFESDDRAERRLKQLHAAEAEVEALRAERDRLAGELGGAHHDRVAAESSLAAAERERDEWKQSDNEVRVIFRAERVRAEKAESLLAEAVGALRLLKHEVDASGNGSAGNDGWPKANAAAAAALNKRGTT